MIKGMLLVVVVAGILWVLGYINLSATSKGTEAVTSLHNSVKSMVEKKK